jgi:hypothetical protein
MRLGWENKKASIYINSAWNFIFGGEIPRVGYLAHLGVYALTGIIVAWPLNTFIWTSPALLADAYPYFAIAFAFLLGIGFLSSYLKTTNGRGVRWYWAIIIGFLLPIGILSLGTNASILNWDRYGSGISDTLLYLAVFICLGFPLFCRGSGGEHFTVEYFSINRIFGGIPLLALLVSAGTIFPLSVYGGFFQDGLWVGRKQFDYISYTPSLSTRLDGDFIATCGNLSGVSAYSHSGPIEGFIRDGFTDTRIGILVAKDRSVDIISKNKDTEFSYRESGFRISAGGLKLSGTDTLFQIDPTVNRFMVTADSSYALAENAAAVWTFVFTKFDDSEWDVVITAAKSRPEFEFLKKIKAHATANLVVGTCNIRQAKTP